MSRSRDQYFVWTDLITVIRTVDFRILEKPAHETMAHRYKGAIQVKEFQEISNGRHQVSRLV